MDYICYFCTNYFKVTNEKAYSNLFSRLTAFRDESEVVDASITLNDGTIVHGFYCLGEIIDKKSQRMINESICPWVSELSKIIPTGEAAVIKETGFPDAVNTAIIIGYDNYFFFDLTDFVNAVELERAVRVGYQRAGDMVRYIMPGCELKEYNKETAQ